MLDEPASVAATRPRPSEPEKALSRIVLGSRADAALSQSIWHAVSATYPDLFVFAGDTIQSGVPAASEPDQHLTALHQSYAEFAGLDGFRHLREATPVLAVRHDDEIGGASAGGISKQLFLDFWQAADSDRRRRQEGLYAVETYGPPEARIQVILLDTTGSPARSTLLGEAQWGWLETELQAHAELRIIVSSIEVLTERTIERSWADFPDERARLLKLAVGASGRTVLVSGNKRHGAMYRYQTGISFPLYELSPSSTRDKSAGAREVGAHVLFRPLRMDNFGVIEIDWEQRLIFLEIADDTGATFRSMRVPLAIPLTS